MVSFNDLASHSFIIDQNDFFVQYYNPDALFRYDSNYFHLLFSPVREEFQLIEEMQEQFSIQNQLKHVKFLWPENQGILPDTLSYLSEKEYGLEKLELYSIEPDTFKAGPVDSSIEVKRVDSSLLNEFKAINYTEDLRISPSFAEAKQPFYDTLFSDSAITFFMAFYAGQPAGSCIAVEGEQTIEIDDVFTLPDFRRKGVATALQQTVMKMATEQDKLVILAADAEDSPRDMYKKQGYSYISFQIGAQRQL